MEGNIIQDSGSTFTTVKNILLQILHLPLLLISYVSKFFQKIIAIFTSKNIDFETPSLLSPIGLVLFFVGLFYILYILNKHFDILQKLKTIFPDFSQTTFYNVVSGIWLFLFGLGIKYTSKIIDSELQSRFTNYIKHYWGVVTNALNDQSQGGSSSSKTAVITSYLFYLLTIVSACITIAVVIDFVFSIFSGKTVEESVVNVFWKSIEHVMDSLYLGVASFLDSIWTVISQVIGAIAFKFS
jgi:hypothetical protein